MKRGKIIGVDFPYTDQTGSKIRPALVVSRSDRSDLDVMVAFIGSYRGAALGQADLLLEDTASSFSQTGLKHSSIVKLDKLTTVAMSCIRGEFGELDELLLAQTIRLLCHALEL